MKYNIGYLLSDSHPFNTKTDNKNIKFYTNEDLLRKKLNCFVYDISLRKNKQFSDILDIIIKNNPNITVIPLFIKSEFKRIDSIKRCNFETNYLEDKFGKFAIPLYINEPAQGKLVDHLLRHELYLNYIESTKILNDTTFEAMLKNNFSLIRLFVRSIEIKEKYTYEHSKRVAIYTSIIAEQLGIKDDELCKITLAGYLHDIGKIFIDPKILSKEGSLTDEEFEHIKTHVSLGGYLINKYFNAHFPSDMTNAIIFHHEKYNGKGYPANLMGEAIPYYARILCVADSFDAMTTKRCYNKQKTVEEAIEDIKYQMGKQFDPKIAECLLNILKMPKKDLKNNYKITIDDNHFVNIDLKSYNLPGIIKKCILNTKAEEKVK